jgi:GT2 family glycosyltransferase
MRMAFEQAFESAEEFSHYLWLNDDTLLLPGSLHNLVRDCAELLKGHPAGVIVVGSTKEPITGRRSYGGLKRLGPLPFTVAVQPRDRVRRCSTMEGNCVLIPQRSAQRVGNLDPGLTHGRGDIDYGYRASSSGVSVWLAAGFQGDCSYHPVGAWRDNTLPLKARLAALRSPKYAIDEKILVAKRHYGALWFLSPLATYLYILLSQPWGSLVRRLQRGRSSAPAK